MNRLRLTLLLMLFVLCATIPSVAATRYEYDALNRLTRVTYDNGHTIQYVYDPAGNITRVVRQGRCATSIVSSSQDDQTVDSHGHFIFQGQRGEAITLRLEAVPPEAGIGKSMAISLRKKNAKDDDDALSRESPSASPAGAGDARKGGKDEDDGKQFRRERQSVLPTELTAVLPATEQFVVTVKSGRGGSTRYVGTYRLTLEASAPGCSTLVVRAKGH